METLATGGSSASERRSRRVPRKRITRVDGRPGSTATAGALSCQPRPLTGPPPPELSPNRRISYLHHASPNTPASRRLDCRLASAEKFDVLARALTRCSTGTSSTRCTAATRRMQECRCTHATCMAENCCLWMIAKRRARDGRWGGAGFADTRIPGAGGKPDDQLPRRKRAYPDPLNASGAPSLFPLLSCAAAETGKARSGAQRQERSRGPLSGARNPTPQLSVLQVALHCAFRR